MNSLNIFSQMTKEWMTKFSFLEETGLNHLYLTILGLAKSKNDLAKLHDILSDNQKILRTDLIELENFWAKYFDLETGRLTPREQAGWIISRQTDRQKNSLYPIVISDSPRNNCRYYYQYLKGRAREPRTDEVDLNDELSFNNHIIIGSPDRIGHGYAHFWAALIDGQNSSNEYMLDLELSIGSNEQEIIVRFIAYEYLLDEPVTYFLSKFPPYLSVSRSSSSHLGSQLDFSYSISVAALIDKLNSYIPVNSPQSKYYIADENFLNGLVKQIQESLGIEVFTIEPITNDMKRLSN
jgi:hypothetical protein